MHATRWIGLILAVLLQHRLVSLLTQFSTGTSKTCALKFHKFFKQRLTIGSHKVATGLSLYCSKLDTVGMSYF